MTNAGFTSLEEYVDLESVNHYRDAVARGAEPAEVLAVLAAKSRDNARTPMLWDDGPHGGFTSGTPWLPAHRDRSTTNAAANVADPGSVFHHYRGLIALRHASEVVVEGRFSLLLPDDPQVWAFTRTLGPEALLVLANCSSTPAGVRADAVPALARSEVLLPTHGMSHSLTLQPWESRIHRLRGPHDWRA